MGIAKYGFIFLNGVNKYRVSTTDDLHINWYTFNHFHKEPGWVLHVSALGDAKLFNANQKSIHEPSDLIET